MDAIIRFLQDTGFYLFSQDGNWRCLIMLGIACVLLYLGIVKKFEPLLLVPIAFGMLITNLPGANMFHEIFFAGGHIHWDLIGGQPVTASLLADLHSQGVAENVLAPYIQQLMTAAQTTFSPEMVEQAIAAVTEEAGAAITVLEAQLQALVQAEQAAAYYGMTLSDITITPGLVDILYLGVKLGIYPCLIFMGVGAMTDFGPLIANPKSLLLGAAAQLGIFITFVALLVPSAAPLIACLMLGNLFKECGVTERLSKTVQNELINIVTIFLGVSVGATATGTTFLSLQTIKIMAMGVVAFSFGTAGGVLLAKFMNLFLKEKINPLIGSAGVSAVPMAARVSQMVGQKYNPGNFLLMHAMGPNVAGVIGSAIAAGVLISLYG
ncbi:sodium ion-translocating decarboxylase subunit beta [Dysosmobacter sp.]|uniref:sodium ion-translocating decarboxylase subunit beta n=1 Tax=Dysosmobacter sp. TaxID=2591382 RepID=UPI003AEF8846